MKIILIQGLLMQSQAILLCILSASSFTLHSASNEESYFDEENGTFNTYLTLTAESIAEFTVLSNKIIDRGTSFEDRAVYKKDMIKNHAFQACMYTAIQSIAGENPTIAESMIVLRTPSLLSNKSLDLCDRVGEGYMCNGQWKDAQSILEHVVKHKKASSAIINLSSAHVQQGHYKEAHDCLKELERQNYTLPNEVKQFIGCLKKEINENLSTEKQ